MVNNGGYKWGERTKKMTCALELCNNIFESYESSNRKYCSLICYGLSRRGLSPKNKGIPKTEEQKLNHSEIIKQKWLEGKYLQRQFNPNHYSKTEEGKKQISLRQRNEKHWNWQGGKANLNTIIRRSEKYKQWRLKIFEKDNYTCQICNIRSSKNHYLYIQADHIKPFALILKENNIKTFEDAEKCKDLWDLNNGRTLCIDCHKKTETYGVKKK